MLLHFELSMKKKSRYISWNILLLWGFVLWIALCIRNIYHSDTVIREDTLYCQQNWNSLNSYNIATKAEMMKVVIHSVSTNYAYYNIILMLEALLQYIHLFLLMCFMLLFGHKNEYLMKKAKIWDNITGYNLIDFLKNYKKSIGNSTIKNDHNTLQSNLIVSYETTVEKSGFPSEQKNGKRVLDEEKKRNLFDTCINTVQDEITFSSCTLLLFNSYELYQCFTDRQLKNTFNFSWIYSMVLESRYVRYDRMFFSNYNKNAYNLFKKRLGKGIISSSPEFQELFANLKKSRLFYPCMIEVSTSYVIRIKSIYK